MGTFLKFTQFRTARPTPSLERIKAFYGPTGLNLPIIGSFQDHSDYSGTIYGLPDASHQLEFTEYNGSDPHKIPKTFAPSSGDQLLVFYMPDKAELDRVVDRLVAVGGKIVESENPYWTEKGVTVKDPDGWRVVLMNSKGFESS
ncbi:uncharacterized protein SPPG_06134 [Spizellomyces punctatus DAOM BR117]|uniref:VOC domain-containing protein n=1 Tax=Spizellomyces punctatus (strain DAOM BR117) TaxID=645134 RepID=A0A0L0HA46_SPIPD|nr:uncharacterized protein SPPG_06134 [Spizellomyces punctatus DAOM BR117]KNC98430.1 hypothetical protein SPPG_06134 [Spizellomyces punctatus DAOM BR117]|eukprot:XP_016606470.1 hypothetical protein SPPG_06134 [Spizellomyces punctatus DAOM BR117]